MNRTKNLVSGLLFCLCPLMVTATPERVVAIGGAVTEIIYGLDVQEVLVGNDTTSYYPPEADTLPKVGYMRALSAEGILSLNPDLIILSNEAGPPAVIEQIKSVGLRLLEVRAARSLDDIIHNITIIADALGRSRQAQRLITGIKRQRASLTHAIAAQSHSKRVMFILQHSGRGPMVGGKDTAADSIITLSGAKNVVVDFDGYKPLTPEAAVVLKPEVILLTTHSLEQIGGEKALFKIPGIGLTPAARYGHVIAMDPLLILGFGPRTAQAALELHHKIAEISNELPHQ